MMMTMSTTAIDFMEQFVDPHRPMMTETFEIVRAALALQGYIVSKPSVLQDWVTGLPGLRHQGVLLTVIRGCDTAPKHDPSKLFTRCIRAVILNAFVGDPKKAQTFIEAVEPPVERERLAAFRSNLDHYPHHYVMHVAHALEIIGYHHPDIAVRVRFRSYYERMAAGLHMNPESMRDCDDRLTLNEDDFGKKDREWRGSEIPKLPPEEPTARSK